VKAQNSSAVDHAGDRSRRWQIHDDVIKFRFRLSMIEIRSVLQKHVLLSRRAVQTKCSDVT